MEGLNNLLQTYEIFLKLIYLKLLQEYWTYEWNLWNRLVKVVQYNAPDNGECVEVSYEYDALNHRIKRTSYDEDNKEREVTKYAYGRNGALAYQEKTKDGSVTKRSFAYLNNEIVGFTDKTGEEESVYYTVTDIQSSEDGSAFISEDPVRDGANWYGYAGCNPMVYVDRIGLAPSNDYLGPGVEGPQPKPQTQEKGFVPLVQNPSENPQNQTPNITGGGPSGVPMDVSPNLTNDNLQGGNIKEKSRTSVEIMCEINKLREEMNDYGELSEAQFDMFMILAKDYNLAVIEEGNLSLYNYVKKV